MKKLSLLSTYFMWRFNRTITQKVHSTAMAVCLGSN